MTYAEQTAALRNATNELAARTPKHGPAVLMLAALERHTAWCERLVREGNEQFGGSYESALVILGGSKPAAVARQYVAPLRRELAKQRAEA